jgi:hypothetical protein
MIGQNPKKSNAKKITWVRSQANKPKTMLNDKKNYQFDQTYLCNASLMSC